MTATAAKTNAEATAALTAYQWEPQPQAAAFVKRVVDDFLEKLPEAKAFADRLYRETGNRFADLVDMIAVPESSAGPEEIEAAGWEVDVDADVAPMCRGFKNPRGMFPKVILGPAYGHAIWLKVESVAVFLQANGLSGNISHDEGDCYRSATFAKGGDHELLAVERHGYDGFSNGSYRGKVVPDVVMSREVDELFRNRPRELGGEEGLDDLESRIDKAIAAVGRDVACDQFFRAERIYWEKRNTAARYQKARQDRLGIGWANHDHHTYRSSRRHFHRLVGLWEKLGFECRERFYPGPDAGWGAQVMEQPVCGIVTFNDVDISEREMLTDFAHEPMEDRTPEEGGLATVGLWCGLHGESVLQAGMHHLECTFDFAALEEQMKTEAGIDTMPKFTDFPHLKQAFTKGERWQVDPARVDALLAKGLITEHQAKEFKKNGAIGSHLENLERNDGFKGFNQTGVTDIIKRTDPRHVA